MLSYILLAIVLGSSVVSVGIFVYLVIDSVGLDITSSNTGVISNLEIMLIDVIKIQTDRIDYYDSKLQSVKDSKCIIKKLMRYSQLKY